METKITDIKNYMMQQGNPSNQFQLKSDGRKMNQISTMSVVPKKNDSFDEPLPENENLEIEEDQDVPKTNQSNSVLLKSLHAYNNNIRNKMPSRIDVDANDDLQDVSLEQLVDQIKTIQPSISMKRNQSFGQPVILNQCKTRRQLDRQYHKQTQQYNRSQSQLKINQSRNNDSSRLYILAVQKQKRKYDVCLNNQIQKSESEMQQCSFTPQIIGFKYKRSNSVATTKRNYEEFYNDQIKLNKNVEMKKNYFEDLKIQESSLRKQQLSKVLCQRQKVYQKLEKKYKADAAAYKQRKMSQSDKKEKKKSVQNKDIQDITDRLYCDKRKIDFINDQNYRTPTSPKKEVTQSDKYQALKLEKEFRNGVNQLKLNQQANKEQIFELLVVLGYLKPLSLVTSPYVAEENIKFFEKMLRQFSQHGDGEYKIEDVRVFLFALNFMYGDWINCETQSSPQRLITVPQKQATFCVSSDEQCLKLAQEFHVLTLNKRFFIPLESKQQLCQKQEVKEKPEISQNSKILAQKVRDAEQGEIHQRLYNETFIARQRKLDAIQIRIEEQLSKCVFSPNAQKQRPSVSPQQKWVQQQQMNQRLMKNLESHKYKGVSSIDREFLKAMDELSFQPNVGRSPKTSPKIRKIEPPNLVSETQQESLQLNVEQDKEPIMFLDVNLGNGQMKRLVLNDGDDYIEVVDQFCLQYSLNQRKKDKLTGVIRTQLSQMLTAIKENDEESI